MRKLENPIWLQMHRKGYTAEMLLRYFGAKRPPIDVHSLAAQLGANVIESREAEYDGSVDAKDPRRTTITVKSSQSLDRQRFTVAHELGHLLLHGSGRFFQDQWNRLDHDPIEIEANRFAADLLMPAWMVKAAVHRNPKARVAQLADFFGVSHQAMTYRLDNLGFNLV